MAQVDYFLKIDGVAGESTDDKHKGEIDVESFSWGETNSGTSGHGGGGGAGKVSHQDLTVTKRIDKSSPVLFIACATGQHFKDALITARKAGGTQQEYLKMKMEDVLVSSYQTSASGGGGLVYETVSFNFSKLEIAYKEQKPDGTLGGESKQKYDFAANKKL
jgi:type VI secretion system secreted protein Hcp